MLLKVKVVLVPTNHCKAAQFNQLFTHTHTHTNKQIHTHTYTLRFKSEDRVPGELQTFPDVGVKRPSLSSYQEPNPVCAVTSYSLQ
jgi:hypothetical protein